MAKKQIKKTGPQPASKVTGAQKARNMESAAKQAARPAKQPQRAQTPKKGQKPQQPAQPQARKTMSLPTVGKRSGVNRAISQRQSTSQPAGKITLSDRQGGGGQSADFRPPVIRGMGLSQKFMLSISGMLGAILIFFFIIVYFIANDSLAREIKSGGASQIRSFASLGKNYIITVYNDKFIGALMKDVKAKESLKKRYNELRVKLLSSYDSRIANDYPFFGKMMLHDKDVSYTSLKDFRRDISLASVYFFGFYDPAQWMNPYKDNIDTLYNTEIPSVYREDVHIASFYYFCNMNLNQYSAEQQESLKKGWNYYLSVENTAIQTIQEVYREEFYTNYIKTIKDQDPRLRGLFFGRHESATMKVESFQSPDKFTPTQVQSLTLYDGTNEENGVSMSEDEGGVIQFTKTFKTEIQSGDAANTAKTVEFIAILEYDADLLNKPTQKLLTYLFIIALLAMVIGISVSYFLAHAVTKPIMHLVDVVQLIAKQDFSVRTSIRSRDELGVLAKTLDSMCERLQDAGQLAKDYAIVKHDLNIAEEVVIQLLPESIPQIPGYDVNAYYHPAKEIGGDYYDFNEIDDNHIGMIIADVSGKGIPGAMVMTMARSVIRNEAQDNLSTRDVFVKANYHIARDIKRGMFVTAFYLILNKLKAEMKVASAGHNPMYVWRAQTGEVEAINPNGIALGFDKGQIFERTIKEETVQLYSGDRIVIYTDGVVEAMSPEGEEFTEERFIQLIQENAHVSSNQLTNIIEQELIAHQGSPDLQHDDITIITFKVL